MKGRARTVAQDAPIPDALGLMELLRADAVRRAMQQAAADVMDNVFKQETEGQETRGEMVRDDTG
jgi:hypothetical protein